MTGECEGGENRPIVAFLGPIASYSHQAARRAFDERSGRLLPTDTIKDVFGLVQAGAASYGVVPFENSTYGVVSYSLDGLADRHDMYVDLGVCGEIYMDVHHCLIGYKASGENSDDDLSHIERVYSHPQALGQTERFRSSQLRNIETIEVSSTSRAAELASQETSGRIAAVASRLAADMYGLHVLAANIEDRQDNMTRFFVVRREGQDTAALPETLRRRGGRATGQDESGKPEYGFWHKSLVSFAVPHRTPGALADVLHCFKRLGLNLTSINSLPSWIQPFQYLFLVEFEGSRAHDPEGRVAALVMDVERVAERWRWLGSWENQAR